MTLSGKARVAGVIGWPIGHSRSPRLHGYWLAQHNINGAYVPLAVAPGGLERAVRALPALGLRGVNVTIPHKEPVLAALDRISPDAQRIGAVNTIVVDEDGKLEGRNTDGFGFLANLREGCPGWTAGAGPAVVMGAGGAARAIVVALLDAGAPEVRLVNRTRNRAESLAIAIKGAGTLGAIRLISWEERTRALADAAVLVNTTTQGMSGQPPLDLSLDDLPPTALVTDIVYTPLDTPLLCAARARGNPTVDGIGMLLHQARPGFAAWFGVMPEVTPELRHFVLAG